MNAALGVFAATWAAFSLAQPVAGQAGDRVSERFPTGSIRSVAEADAALSAAAEERAEIEARYVVEEQACHPKFFATSCIEQAKERRRVAMSALRPVEIEANAFKRQVRVAERDKLLAERLEKDDRERQERINNLPATEAAVRTLPDEASRKVQTTLFSDRQDKHDAKMKQQNAADRASAEKRAANVAAYEKKKTDALARQQKVAQRKAEKEQKRKAKQAQSGKLQ